MSNDNKNIDNIINRYNKLNELTDSINTIKTDIKIKNDTFGNIIENLKNILNNYSDLIQVEFNNDDRAACEARINSITDNLKLDFFSNKDMKDTLLKEINELDSQLIKYMGEKKEIEEKLENMDDLNNLIADELNKHLDIMKTYGGYKHDIMCYVCHENKNFIPCKLKFTCSCEYIVCYDCARQITQTMYIENETDTDRKYRRNNRIKCIICPTELKSNSLISSMIYVDLKLMKNLTNSLKFFKEKFKKKYKIDIKLFNCNKCDIKLNSLTDLYQHIVHDCNDEIIYCSECMNTHKRGSGCSATI